MAVGFCLFAAVSFLVIYLKVHALDVKSKFIYPATKNFAVLNCSWTISQRPTLIEFLSSDSRRYFACDINYTPYFCSKGPAATGRHTVDTSTKGYAWMTISNVQPSDAGQYSCDIFKSQAGSFDKSSSHTSLNLAEMHLEVSIALEVNSTIDSPDKGRTAVFQCAWNKYQRPTRIEFLASDNRVYFSCELVTPSNTCTRGPAASDRHEVYSSPDGLTWMMIRYMEPSDEGTYSCFLFRVNPISGEIKKMSSISYLDYKQYHYVKPVEVKSSISYPVTGKNAVMNCKWSVDLHPTTLLILGKDRRTLFTCDLTSYPYPCARGSIASNRHNLNNAATGLVSMTINDVQLYDQGVFRCQILKFTPGTNAVLADVSDSFLSVKGNVNQQTTLDVRSTMTYAPPTGNQAFKAVLKCNWNVELQPTTLLIMGKERQPLFTCDLTFIPYGCIRGSFTLSRQVISSAIVGTVTMSIINIQTSDEGRYTCQILKFLPGSININSYVHDSYLSIKENIKTPGAFEVKSSISYQATGRNEFQAVVNCRWDTSLKPTSLYFLGREQPPLFTWTIHSIPYSCMRGFYATSRFESSTDEPGSVLMTIDNIQFSDEGTYRCQLMKINPGSSKVNATVSDSYLRLKDAKNFISSRSQSGAEDTSEINVHLILAAYILSSIVSRYFKI